MNHSDNHSPPPWTIGLGFALLYVSWGTTYLPIRIGVYDEGIPPLLFGGTRVFLAGVCLLVFQAFSGGSLRISWRDLCICFGVCWLLFVGGNGLMNTAGQTVESGLCAVLAATTPLWLGVLAMLWPKGERLNARGWLGLWIGLGGVLILLGPQLSSPAALFRDYGPMLVLASAIAWALGSLVLRQVRLQTPHLTAAGYQLLLGGAILTCLALALGEHQRLPDRITPRAAFAFFYLLIFGSLVGYVAFNWLMGHVSAARVGTYAYVNPVIAVVVGWQAGESITVALVAGISVILFGVFLVRGGELPAQIAPVAEPAPVVLAKDDEPAAQSSEVS
ncbi:MAG: EamA family transporter [Gemmataceae bacterium]|nr:EamA family transporter [Gemmataceae bacterium]MCI0742468.1 EamA family transporter [Gemmataceae bacterium]